MDKYKILIDKILEELRNNLGISDCPESYYCETCKKRKQFLKQKFQEVRQENIQECIDKIENMKLWSKGTVKGTRNDILANLTKLKDEK